MLSFNGICFTWINSDERIRMKNRQTLHFFGKIKRWKHDNMKTRKHGKLKRLLLHFTESQRSKIQETFLDFFLYCTPWSEERRRVWLAADGSLTNTDQFKQISTNWRKTKKKKTWFDSWVFFLENLYRSKSFFQHNLKRLRIYLLCDVQSTHN